MECDVIPDCSQDVDPLGNFANCDSLAATDDAQHVFALDAQLVSSTDASSCYHAQSLLPASTSISRPPPHPSLQQGGVATSAHTDTNHAAAKADNGATTSGQPAALSLSAARRKISTKTAANHTANKKPPRTTTPKAVESGEVTAAQTPSSATQASTMREVLASIPGFSIKPRRRTAKKMSTAAQIAQTREGCIDLETPDSILVGANLRSLLNKHTFLMLPPFFQKKLVQLLPGVDRPPVDPDPNAGIRLIASSLNNEFFARACLEWRDRLAEGEFTPENQIKLRADAEKEKSRIDPWKLKHFEPIWGRDRNNLPHVTTMTTVGKADFQMEPAASGEAPITSSSSTTTTCYTTSSGRTVRNSATTCNSVPAIQKRSPRTVGATTRASAAAVVHQSPEADSIRNAEPVVAHRVLDLNVPEEVPDALAIAIPDDIDTIVIPDDDPVTTSSGVTLTITSSVTSPMSLMPTAYTIPAGIEVIPLDNSQSSATMIKRAHANSPDRNQIKICKYEVREHSRSPSQPGHHHRSPIPSKPSPPVHAKHNGSSSCAVSDVIQIIKLPTDAAAQHHQQTHNQPSANDKQPADTKSWTSVPDASLPVMSVAVTTIAAPPSSSHIEQQRKHNTPTTPPPAVAPNIELIKRCTPQKPSMFVTAFAAALRRNADDAKNGDILTLGDAEQPPVLPPTLPATDHHHLDLDVDESSFAESAADHVFRAMVCHGDDVLCGDGNLTSVHHDPEEPSKSAVLYSQAYDAAQTTATITIDDSQPPTALGELGDDRSAATLSAVAVTNDDLLFTTGLPPAEAPDQCDGIRRQPAPVANDDDARAATSEEEAMAVVDNDEDDVAVEAAVEELEPSIQSLVELDPIEQEFNDAENYVLESGEISADSVGECVFTFNHIQSRINFVNATEYSSKFMTEID